MASISIGIVGLPNVGKSTLFNALFKKSPFAKASEEKAGCAKIGNYPFTTIDPNVGVVEVPDERLPVLAKIVNTQKIVPAVVEFYDIAGLVKGAAEGEGLGNKFLSHIREVAAIAHVVRLFEDTDVIHVQNTVDALRDIQTIETELVLADLSTLEKQREPKPHSSRLPSRSTQSREDENRWNAVIKLKGHLNAGNPAQTLRLTDDEQEVARDLHLLTMKPVIFVFNVSEEQLMNKEETEKQIVKLLDGYIVNNETIKQFNNFILINAKLENDVLAFSDEDQKEYLNQYGLKETGLNRLIKKAYETLGLISFLTAGQIEARAWTIKKGTLAPQAAGTIHTDFEKKFIKADIISFEKFTNSGGWKKARDAGKVQIAGKDYIIQDGDVIEFKIGQ